MASREGLRLGIGIDFGTSGIRVALGSADNDKAEPICVPMREVFGWEGQRVPSTKFPSAVQFGPRHGQYKLLGNRAAGEQQSILDVATTSSGAKLSLDPTQSEKGDAAHFLRLCREYKVDPVQVRLSLLRAVKEKVDVFLAARYPGSSDPWEQVISTRIGIPYIWSSASDDASYAHGDAIQMELLDMMKKVGFPNLVTPENEAMSALRYHLRGKKTLLGDFEKDTVRALLIDAGEGTTDLAPVELVLVGGKWRVMEIAQAKGCCGGTSYIWTLLAKLCQKRRAQYKDAGAMYQQAQLHFFKMGETSVLFSYGDSTISTGYFKEAMEKAYKDPLDLAVEEASRIENLDLILMSGAAFANSCIKQLWENRLRSPIKSRSGKALSQTAPKLVFLDPNDASVAVAKGACLPYNDNPMKEFHKSCFGILIDNGRRSLLQLKRAGSYDFEAEFQTVCVSDPEEFLVEPHYLVPETVDFEDDTTTTTEWDATSALPMGNFKFNLQGRVWGDEEVGIRFLWQSGRPGSSDIVLLELAAGSWHVTQQLQLVRDMDRVYFIPGEVREEGIGLGSRIDHDKGMAQNAGETGRGSGGHTDPEGAEAELGDVADGETADDEGMSPTSSATVDPPYCRRKRSARAILGSSETPERRDAAQLGEHDQPEHTAEGVASESQHDVAGKGTDEKAGDQTTGAQGELNIVVFESREGLDDADTTPNAAVDDEQGASSSQEEVDSEVTETRRSSKRRRRHDEIPVGEGGQPLAERLGRPPKIRATKPTNRKAARNKGGRSDAGNEEIPAEHALGSDDSPTTTAPSSSGGSKRRWGFWGVVS